MKKKVKSKDNISDQKYKLMIDNLNRIQRLEDRMLVLETSQLRK